VTIVAYPYPFIKPNKFSIRPGNFSRHRGHRFQHLGPPKICLKIWLWDGFDRKSLVKPKVLGKSWPLNGLFSSNHGVDYPRLMAYGFWMVSASSQVLWEDDGCWSIWKWTSCSKITIQSLVSDSTNARIPAKGELLNNNINPGFINSDYSLRGSPQQ